MMPSALYSIAQIRAAEQAAMRTLPAGTLMLRAARAAAEAALAMLKVPPSQAKVLVLAGPGNNGGDALACAALLRTAGVAVAVCLAGDPGAYGSDAAQAWQRALAGGVRLIEAEQMRQSWSLVIDGLFGIGLTRAIGGAAGDMIMQVNAMPAPVLALDVPSGLDADTGNVIGGGAAIRADATITFIGDKPGLHTADGGDHAGAITLAELAIAPALLPPAAMHLNGPALFAASLTPRARNTHKGTFGTVAVIGGADGMAGAPVLAARAAACCGAGRVFVGFAGQAPALDFAHPELMCRAAEKIDFAASTLVLGPGLSTAGPMRTLLAQAIASPQALVLDADGLNLLAADSALQRQLARRRAATLLTPHPLEAARLLGTSAAAIQADRLGCARRLAAQLNAVVVLKGFGSIIAGADGGAVVNPSGNPALATAGSGDVLSGICGALLAQHWPLWEAALGAVWLHGAAADRLVEDGTGPIGLTASELIPAARRLLNALIQERMQ